jgi:4-hydroxybenzoate polyprenyltransferase
LHSWLRALRPHQWVKNALIFLPLLLSGTQASLADLAHAVQGFAAFCLAASAGYVVNDLLDLATDRRHPVRQNRPFAAGKLSPWTGVLTAVLAVSVAALLGLGLPPLFRLILPVYFVGSVLYSTVIKRFIPFDIITLALLFTIRLLAGMAFVAVPISLWFLTFALLFFLSLAAVKRYAELHRHKEHGEATRTDRGYVVGDMPFILAAGIGAGICAVLIFVIYLMLDRFPAKVYVRPAMLWFIAPIILAWLLHIWMLAGRGRMNEDPILFALRDPPSWVLGALCAVFVAAAW